jgi:hypothetical protein
VLFTEFLSHSLSSELVVKLSALGNKLTSDLHLRCHRHVPNLTLDLTEHRLEQVIFLVVRILVVKHVLHSFVVTLFSVNGKLLELSLVLREVQDSLGDDNISVDPSVQIEEVGPVLSLLHLHRVKHKALVSGLTHRTNIV